LAFGGLVATIVQSADWTRQLQEQLKIMLPVACGAFVVACLAARSGSLPFPFTLNYALLALIFSLLVFHCATRAGEENAFCGIARWRPLRSVGKFSYSIYVFHVVVHRYVPRRVAVLMVTTGLTSWVPVPVLLFIIVIVCVATAYLVGVVTWHLFEKHFLKLKNHFAYNILAPESVPAPPPEGLDVETGLVSLGSAPAPN